MTVADELANRNHCRFKLTGVLVAVDGRGRAVPVDHTCWNADSELVVVLVTGSSLPPSRCHLRSLWPVACCQPRQQNLWNSRHGKFCRA